MVFLAMYKGKGLIGNSLIRWWTDSQYSHCEIGVNEICYSSSLSDGGVRCKAINLKPDNWDLYPIPWARADDVISYYNKTQFQPYGLFDLTMRQIMRLPATDRRGQFCSEWCANALGLPDARDISPAGLLRICLTLNVKMAT